VGKQDRKSTILGCAIAPSAAEGAIRRLAGRDAIAAYMRQLPTFIRFGTLSDVRVRETGDEFIIEATGHHRRIPDDTQRDLSYGKAVHFRDYMTPPAATDAIDQRASARDGNGEMGRCGAELGGCCRSFHARRLGVELKRLSVSN
jgi:hypothetical protein